MELAAEYARVALPDHPPDLQEEMGGVPRLGELFEALCDQMRRERSWTRHRRDLNELWERLQRALPEDIVKDLVRYDDLKNDEAQIERDAAYFIGFALGRRRAGHDVAVRDRGRR